MARETKAERLAREAELRQLRERAFLTEYPAKLTQLVYEFATKDTSKFEVKRNTVESTFELNALTDRGYFKQSYTLPFLLEQYNPAIEMEVQEAEWQISEYDRRLAEEQRLREVKKTALKKLNELLSDEERAALNLN